jgi:DDE superfamily endonuclease/Archaeal putative transposase ISC1217
MARISDRPQQPPAQKELRRQLRGRRPSAKRLRQQLRDYRRRLARKARASRRRIADDHHRLPAPVRAAFEPLAPALTRPTYHRLVLLALAALLTIGGRTVANLLRTLGALAHGHPSSDHRALSHRRWPVRRLARRYIAAVLDRFAPDGPILLAGDDTVTEHRGAKVYGKGRHRDPVRSTRSFTAYRWGHKWVVLAVLDRPASGRRRWALPLMVALYRPEEKTEAGPGGPRPRRAHKTPPDLLAQMLRILLRWFPERTFVCCGDGNYATHELAELAAAHPGRLTFVSKFSEDANLFEPPPPYSGNGRPRVKGEELPKPASVVRDAAERPEMEVAWYGGGRRRVETVTGVGHWYKSGRPLVPVRWVFVRDRAGTHRDEYFFTTAEAMSPKEVIETYTARWNIETTFQEMRAYLGLETTRGRVRATVLRAEPGLFALYTLVAWLDAEAPARYRRDRLVDWAGKPEVTFSDAITAVRRWLWVEWVFARPGHREAFQKLGGDLRRILLNGLAPAA